MTVETKTTIQASDITSVEFECKNCGAVSVWPIKVAKNPPTMCNCSPDQRWMTIGGASYASIVDFIELIRRMAELSNEPFVMRLGLSDHVSAGKD